MRLTSLKRLGFRSGSLSILHLADMAHRGTLIMEPHRVSRKDLLLCVKAFVVLRDSVVGGGEAVMEGVRILSIPTIVYRVNTYYRVQAYS